MSDEYRLEDWQAALSDALDEIWALRQLLAREARTVEAHLSLRSFPKSRRHIAEQSVDRMRRAALGLPYDRHPHARQEYQALNPPPLTASGRLQDVRRACQTCGGTTTPIVGRTMFNTCPACQPQVAGAAQA